MIEKVVLENFQCHKKLEVECGNFTTLTGGSNGGKSAVLRAILGLVRNDSASDYVRVGQKNLTVTLCLSDGYTVKWEKGTGTNRYTLTSPDEAEERVFDKVGADVPDEVKEVLKLGPVAIKGSDKEYVNFHSQLAAPFLISATPGATAKLFGELTSASQLYTAVSEGNRQARSTRSLKSTRKEDLENATDRLSDFEGLEGTQEALDDAYKLFEQAREVDAKVTRLQGLTEDYTKSAQSEVGISDALPMVKEASHIDLTDLEHHQTQSHRLKKMIGALSEGDRREEVFNTNIKVLEPASSVSLDDLIEYNRLISSLSEGIGLLQEKEAQEESIEQLASDAEKDISGIEKEIELLMIGLTECPSCGQELTEDGKHMLIKEAAHV